jgi:hypothetical protein
VGLLMFGRRQSMSAASTTRVDGGLAGVWERMKNWFQGNF